MNDGLILMIWWEGDPRCVIISMCKVYPTVISIFSPVSIIVNLDQEYSDTRIKNSPIKLMVGGKAKLFKQAINHHVVIKGRVISRPRVRIIVRLWVRS